MADILSDPHAILGVDASATPDEVRQAYLAKVRENPPEREPEKFREIHSAYQMLVDPLAQARAILDSVRQRPNLNEIIETAHSRRARLSTLTLLALGNRD